jgi:transketolase
MGASYTKGLWLFPKEAPPVAQPAAAPAPAPPTPQETLNSYIAQAQQSIAASQAQQVAPYAGVEAVLQRAAEQQAEFQKAAEQRAAEQQAAWQKQAEAQQQAAQQQQAALQNLMIQQQSAYQQQIVEAQRQQAEMAARAAESSRQTEALQRAFVPQLEPTAAAPMLGDTRTSTTRNAATNTLSNLAILTGLTGDTSGGVTTSLAGLQIA